MAPFATGGGLSPAMRAKVGERRGPVNRGVPSVVRCGFSATAVPLVLAARQPTARRAHLSPVTVNEPSSPAAAPGNPVDASMHDMLRIMDVASTLRRQRETAESQLDVDAAKAMLRQRLLATAEAAGETVTAAEVDAAIEQYFARQHRYEDPPPSWRRLRAHLWVNRLQVVVGLGFALVLVFGAIALAGAYAAPTPRAQAPVASATPVVVTPPPQPTPVPAPAPPVQAPIAPTPAVVAPTPQRDEFAEAWQDFQASMATARKLAGDDGARARLDQVMAVAEAAGPRKDLSRLRSARRELDEVVTRLDEEYEVRVVDRPGEQSGVDRYFGGKLSGYYVIVEARTADGKTLRRRIVNHETKSRDEVMKWGEEVDETVWNRLVADKRADGVVDDALFARKRRGTLAEDVVMRGGDKKPLVRGRSITSW